MPREKGVLSAPEHFPYRYNGKSSTLTREQIKLIALAQVRNVGKSYIIEASDEPAKPFRSPWWSSWRQGAIWDVAHFCCGRNEGGNGWISFLCAREFPAIQHRVEGNRVVGGQIAGWIDLVVDGCDCQSGK
jgi:hypothetical protein